MPWYLPHSGHPLSIVIYPYINDEWRLVLHWGSGNMLTFQTHQPNREAVEALSEEVKKVVERSIAEIESML